MQQESPHLVLFTNFGKARPTSAEEARQTHNATAGNPAGVAAAQALGDLSHLVYVPAGDWTGDLMFLDQWTSAGGIQQFFADPQVQEGAAALFTSYDPVVWRPAEGFNAYHIASPLAQRERNVSVLRATVTSLDTARTAINQIWQQRVLAAHRQGLDSHEFFVRLAPPGSPEALEVLGVDRWATQDGPRTLYDDPAFKQALYGIFTSQPRSWLLHHPAGEWIEW